MHASDPNQNPLDDLLLDPEDWAPPQRLSADECFDEIGADWRNRADSGFTRDEEN